MLSDSKTVRLSSYVEDSIVDGPGLRIAIYAQGCLHGCPGCHNPQTHDPDGGTEYEVDSIIDIILSNPMTTGVTYSGGEPLLQPGPLLLIAKATNELRLDNWMFTGYDWENIIRMMETSEEIRALIEAMDVVVDGKYDESKRDLTLYFKGSANQRTIDVKKSLSSGKIVEYQAKKFIDEEY